MWKVTEEAYVISMNELIALLKGLGVKKCYGIIREEWNMTEQDVLTALNEMTKKHILVTDKEKFILNTEYKEMAMTIGNAEYVVVCHNSHWKNEFCLYLGEENVKCRQSPYQEKMYVLQQIGSSAIKNIWYEECIIPEKSDVQELNESLFEQESNREDEESKYISVTDIFNTETDEVTSIVLIKDGLLCYMLVKDGKKTYREPYTEQKYIEIIKRTTGGKFEW